MIFGQLLVSAATLGATYALISLGFVLTLNASRAVNFAHGDIAMSGGMIAVLLAALLPAGDLPIVAQAHGLAILPLLMVAMAAVGLLVAGLAYAPLHRAPPTALFVSTIALGIMLQSGATGMMGAAARKTPALVAGAPLTLGGVTLQPQGLATVAIAALLIAALGWLLTGTRFGMRLRAAAADPAMARTIGVSVPAMIAISFALAAMLAGIAAMIAGHHYLLTPMSGAHFMFKAYIAVTLGGWGSLRGAVAGALLIAVAEVFGSWAISALWAEVCLYALVLLVLFLRPQGLFGEASGRRV